MTDFDIMAREESGSTPTPTPLCLPGEKDDISSVITVNAAGMLHLLLRATLEKKKKAEYRERIRKKYKIILDLKNMAC